MSKDQKEGWTIVAAAVWFIVCLVFSIPAVFYRAYLYGQPDEIFQGNLAGSLLWAGGWGSLVGLLIALLGFWLVIGIVEYRKVPAEIAARVWGGISYTWHLLHSTDQPVLEKPDTQRLEAQRELDEHLKPLRR